LISNKSWETIPRYLRLHKRKTNNEREQNINISHHDILKTTYAYENLYLADRRGKELSMSWGG